MSTSNTTEVHHFYDYEPNIPLAYVAAAFFAVCAVAVFILNYRSKMYFMTPLVIGSVMEVIGFLLRRPSEDHLGVFIISLLCILLAPTVFAITDYSLLARL